MIYPYTKNAQIYSCPSLSTAQNMKNDDLANQCAANPVTCKTGTAYSWNDVNNIGRVGIVSANEYDPVLMAAVTHPAETLMIMDGRDWDAVWASDMTDVPTGTYYGNAWQGPNTTNKEPGLRQPNYRHNGGFNAIWYDGHAKFLKKSMKATAQYPAGSPYYWYLTKPE